jgi:hypothetical protein
LAVLSVLLPLPASDYIFGIYLQNFLTNNASYRKKGGHEDGCLEYHKNKQR